MPSRSWAVLGALSCFLPSIVACSSSSGTSPVDASSDASPRPDASPLDAAADARKDAGPAAETGADASADAASDVNVDVPFDATGYTPVDGGDAVITTSFTQAWAWVPFAGAHCRDGSTTGIGVNLNPSSTKLMIFLEGGGACFNALTCGTNPASFGPADFAARFPSASDGGVPNAGEGIFDRSNAENPVKDWNFVYVPYCTGDIHAGNNPAAAVPQVSGTQQFVGYNNVDLYLQRLVPTFKTSTQVLLAGASGGGFGAAANYLHVQRAFGSVPVSLLDDSGPYMEDPYLPACFQSEVRALWGLDSTLGADCDGHCNDPGRYFLDFAKYAVTSHPSDTFGMMDSTDDQVITAFYGFGANDCQSFSNVSAQTFTAGLDDIRTQLASSTNHGTFVFTGNQHTSIEDPNFYTRTTTTADGGTVSVASWVGALVGGSVTNVGP